jgi:flagellar basal body rod protein FlgB
VKKVGMNLTNNKHIKPNRNLRNGKYELVKDNSGAMKPNKNNVDLSKQVQKMGQNSDEMSDSP